VGSALADGRSKASSIHGSFGSGKSHFMAMLSLLLRNDEHAWRVPELHALRERHRFVEQAKLLELHFHMIDKASLEAALFETYVDYAKQHHPEASIPALFAESSCSMMCASCSTRWATAPSSSGSAGAPAVPTSGARSRQRRRLEPRALSVDRLCHAPACAIPSRASTPRSSTDSGR
jgi:hypothetical protein